MGRPAQLISLELEEMKKPRCRYWILCSDIIPLCPRRDAVQKTKVCKQVTALARQETGDEKYVLTSLLNRADLHY
jgi:hypothetical protein